MKTLRLIATLTLLASFPAIAEEMPTSPVTLKSTATTGTNASHDSASGEVLSDDFMRDISDGTTSSGKDKVAEEESGETIDQTVRMSTTHLSR